MVTEFSLGSPGETLCDFRLSIIASTKAQPTASPITLTQVRSLSLKNDDFIKIIILDLIFLKSIKFLL